MKVLYEIMEKYPPVNSIVISQDKGGQRRLTVTNRCNLRCVYCPRQSSPGDLSSVRLTREPSLVEMIDAICGTGNCHEVIFSGLGEPTHRLYDVLEVARRLKHKGIRVHLRTDGLANLVHGRSVVEDLEGNVDTLTVLLNAHDAESYNRYCRPVLANAFEAVIDFIKAAREYVPEVTVTAVQGLPGIDLTACRQLAEHLGVGFQERLLGDCC